MEQVKKKSGVLQSAVIGLKLLLVCAIVAGVISFVYAMTADAYEKNLQATKNQAIGEIFGKEGLSCVAVPYDGDEVIYQVLENGSLIGYCVEVKSSGFGGDIEMMVGYSVNGCEPMVLGVSIVAHSETPGLGAKVENGDFLKQFVGQSLDWDGDANFDAISGATISSTAVKQGVEKALASLRTVLLKGGAAE